MIERNIKDECAIYNTLVLLKNCFKEVCHGDTCDECPLGSLNNVFEVTTCEQIEAIVRRLEIIYKVVETL